MVRNKLSLDCKIKALDLLKNGLSVNEVSKQLNLSADTIKYWSYNESKLRRVFELNMDIERIRSTIGGPCDVFKYNQIIERLVMIEEIEKPKKVTLREKIRCLDLLPSLNYDTNKLCKLTGFSKMNIHLWRRTEENLRKIAQSDNTEYNTDYSRRRRLKKEADKTPYYLKRKYPWIKEIETIVDVKSKKIEIIKRSDELSEKIIENNIMKKSDLNVDDEEIKQMLDVQHSNYSLNVKIDALNMYDIGVTLKKISRIKNVTVATLKYWISISSKLRNQSLEIQKLKDLEYLRMTGGELPSNDDLESNITLQKDNVKNSIQATLLPGELKLKIVDYLRKSTFTPATVAEVFGINRHLVRHLSIISDRTTQKLAARDQLRSKRLLTVLTSCNHRTELDRLNRLCAYPNPLEVLGSYLTYGVTRVLSGRGSASAGAKERCRAPAKVSPEIALAMKKRDEIVTSSDRMWQLFRELYCQEYRLLVDIDRRHTIRTAIHRLVPVSVDLCASATTTTTTTKTTMAAKRPAEDEACYCLEQQASSSLARLRTLHNMMLRQ